ncbi:D-alanyl-D-alanine carboxypeptidase [Catenulispora subtropica]|uniref:Peptidase S11 D-alanyl-D-alanine carboxypeptidase A N-terminal domain-containing protein n=1 Tax=Catenulispora subtropica TaxID=450798 RepID=A0ABP5EHE8_9ACTN
MHKSSVHRVITAVAAGLIALGAAAGPAVAAAAPSPTTPTSPASTPLGPTVTAPGTPPIPADVQAGAFVLADQATGLVLAERAPHQKLRPASTLKVLTALALLPKLDPAAVHVAVPDDLADFTKNEPGGSAVGVKPGLSYRVSDLWNGVFLRSGNDAVATLARMAGGVPATVDLMRQTAQRLHADDTTVVNADGYDADGQLSSAYDLALMARAGLMDPGFRAYCSLQRARFPSVNGTTYEIDNENRLLGKYQGMIGVKNGYTSLAHHTFVGAAQRNGRTLVVSVFDAGTDIYQQTAKLLDWGFGVAAGGPGVDQLTTPDPLARSAVPNEALPPPDAQHRPAAADGADRPSSLPSQAASAPAKGAKHGSLLGDVFMTLLYVVLALVGAVVALRARVLWKQRKERSASDS